MLFISLVAAASVLAVFLLLRSSSQKRSKAAAGDILSKEDVAYTARCKKILRDTVDNAPEGAINTYEGQASMISSVRACCCCCNQLLLFVTVSLLRFVWYTYQFI